MLSKSSSVSRWSASRRLWSKSGKTSASGCSPRRLRRYSHCPAKLLPRARARSSLSMRRTCCSSTAGFRRRPAVATVSNSSSGMLLQMKNDRRDASSEIADPIVGARRGLLGILLDAIQESRVNEQETQGAFDARIEVSAARRAPSRRSRGGASCRCRSPARGRRGVRATKGSSCAQRSLVLLRDAGLQVNTFRRLGALSERVALNGPSTVTLSSSGIPTGVIGSRRSRSNGCSSSSVVAELFLRNATPIVCGPAGIFRRFWKRFSISSPASVGCR